MQFEHKPHRNGVDSSGAVTFCHNLVLLLGASSRDLLLELVYINLEFMRLDPCSISFDSSCGNVADIWFVIP